MKTGKPVSFKTTGEDITEASTVILDYIEKRVDKDNTISALEILQAIQTFSIALTDIVFKANRDMARSAVPLTETAYMMRQISENSLDTVRDNYRIDEPRTEVIN